MQLISITATDSNDLPIIPLQDLYDYRTTNDPYAKKIFDAILQDDVDFISSEVTASRLNIDNYIVDLSHEEVAIPLLKLAVLGESISYKVSKYLLSLPEININAYSSNGENTLLGLCGLPYGYWLPACLSSFSRKEIATLLVKHKKINLAAIKYSFNFDSNSYEQTDQTPFKLAQAKSNFFMTNLIANPVLDPGITTAESSEVRTQFIQFHQQLKQVLNQPFFGTNQTSMISNSSSIAVPEVQAIETAIKEAKEMIQSMSGLKLA